MIEATEREFNEIDTLEAKVEDLEKRILGNVKSTKNLSPVIDSFITTNALINTALAGRESASKFFRNLGTLDQLMDPSAEDMASNINAKLEEVFVQETQIQENFKLLKELQELQPVLNSEHIKNVPNLSGKLEKLTTFHLEKIEEADKITEEVKDLLQQYNSVIMNVTKSFVHMEDIITQCEGKAVTKEDNQSFY